jgi:hypothetical protein
VKRSTLPRPAPRLPRDLPGARFLLFAEVIELPAQGLADLDDEALRGLEEKAVAAFDAIRNTDNPSDADVAEAERLAEIVTAVRIEAGSRSEAVDSRRNRLAALGGEIDNTTDDGEADEAEEADDGEDVGEPEAVAASDQTPPVEEQTLVASSSAGGRRRGGAHTDPREIGRVRAQDVSGRSARPLPPVSRPVALTAAADVLGPTRSGEDFPDMEAVAEAVGRRTAEYPTGGSEGTERVRMRHGIATIRKDYPADLIARQVTDDHVLTRAVDQHRLPGNSLVAAGGWCSPSETLYDLVELEAADALIDVPEINVARGGIRFTPGPSFADIFAGTGFSQTEAQAIAGTTKPCYRVPCPPFTEVRAGVEGVCITSGILSDRAFPELTARVVRGALIAHAHKISAKTIAKIIAGSTAVPTLVAQGGAAAPVLNAIELSVEDIKYKHRIARGATLEAVFPAWSLGLIRADLAFRLGVDNYLSIPDATIRGWFTDRHIAPQFVYDWQDTAIGATAEATAWPANLSFLVYPSGTWVRGMGDVISLDSVYDSAGLAVNDFIGLFTEESLLVAKLGHESRQYTVPVCADGTTAAGVDVPCTAVPTGP